MPAQPLEAAPPQAPAKEAPAKEDTRPVIAVFGDSLSAGYGLEAGKSFPDDLQRLLDSQNYRYHVVNEGVSGDTTTDGTIRTPAVLALHPAIVILEFGANDGLRGLPVSTAKANLARMITEFQKSGTRIVLAGMTLPRNYGPDYIASFDRMYRDLAKQYSVTLIPFLLEGVGGNAQLTQADGLHPTAEGAQIVAHTVMRYLQPLLVPSKL